MTKRVKTMTIPILMPTMLAILKSKRMVHFLLDSVRQGNNLIQTVRPFTLHKTTLCLRSKPFKGWNRPAWEDNVKHLLPG
jgi:hypothetical protein